MTEKLSNLISLLPEKPGVYLMKDENDHILYIGKAKSLKKRVSQYFLRPQVGKVAAMVSHVDHFDFILVGSEKESLILEMNLIQTHHPRYNIMLMDDSHYPYIALKKHGDPLLKIARNSNDPKYFYFGPFPSSSSAYQTIDLLNKIYPTRKCRNLPSKPCLYYSLGQCLAPCISPLGEEEASRLYSDIKRFLNGDTSKARAELKEKMDEAIAKLDFELAAEYKKNLDAIAHVTQKQSVEVSSGLENADVFAFATRDGYLSVAILTYRRGLLLGKSSHVVQGFLDETEQAKELVLQYYQNHELPKKVVARLEGLEEEMSLLYEGVEVISPKEGNLFEAVGLASINAKQAIEAYFLTARLEEDNAALLEELASLISIPVPYRIELFDNSHLQGASPVGAMVCYINGVRVPKMYRKFNLPEEIAGDDYHSMAHVVYRRYLRLKEEGQEFPDLLLVDGGLPQAHAALEGLEKAGVEIPVFGLYKNDKHQTSGLLDKDGKTYALDRKSALFFLLMRMQDEVHRYAISFHHAKRGKALTNSIFEGIPGIGKKREETLLRNYPSLESLLLATQSELEQLLPKETAEALYAKLHLAQD